MFSPWWKLQIWKKVLTSSKAESHLARFYTKCICEQAHELLTDSRSIYISGGFDKKAVKVTKDRIMYIHELKFNQEEADTRMMIHVKYSGHKGARRVVLVSPDTDVLLPLLHHFFDLGVFELILKTGRTTTYVNYTRFIPVHSLTECLTTEQRYILLSVYRLTGCRGMFGKEKKTVFKYMLGNAGVWRRLQVSGWKMVFLLKPEVNV